MPAPYEGGCVCGAVRYRLTAEPLTLYACHCTDCQTHCGASFALSMIVLRDALELVRGEPRAYDVTVLEGPRRRGRFCGECATRLWGEPFRFTEVVVIRPGTLDDTSWLDPVAHIWTRSAQPWMIFSKDTIKFETQPEGPLALVELWRKHRATRGRANEALLGSCDIVAFVSTASPERARTFYRDVLGLSLIADEPFALVYDANGVMLRVAKVQLLTPGLHTVLGWSVADIRAAVDTLTKRGVVFERYPALAQDDIGVWKSPSGAQVAWFKDPDGNVLSLTQSAAS